LRSRHAALETLPMTRDRFVCLLLLLLSAALLMSLNGCAGFSSSGSGSASATNPLLGKFQHVIIVFQENRTPDNLFHDPVLIAAGADIASSGVNSSGETVPLTPTPLGINYDLSHAHSAFVAMYDGGQMDGADKVAVACYVPTNCPPANAQFMYVRASDAAPYFQLAEQYTLAIACFKPIRDPAFPLISSLFPARPRRRRPVSCSPPRTLC
jgi:phospholipase C